MNAAEAEEYTQALGQVVAGGWRVAALAERLGVPEALGLTTREWVEQRLGGYLKLSVTQRREAVAELVADGMTQRDVAGVLGVDQATVHRDANASAKGAGRKHTGRSNGTRDADASRELPEDVHTICPTCHGTGLVPVFEEEEHG